MATQLLPSELFSDEEGRSPTLHSPDYYPFKKHTFFLRHSVHSHLFVTFRTPCITTYSHKMSQRTCVFFFFVAFFCNLWVSGWKLGAYHIRARCWSVKAVCGDAVCINHVCICRQVRHSVISHLLEPLRRQLTLALREYCHYARKPRPIGDVHTGTLNTIT